MIDTIHKIILDVLIDYFVILSKFAILVLQWSLDFKCFRLKHCLHDYSIIFLNYDHLLVQCQLSEFSKTTLWHKPNISKKLLLLVAANEGRGHK